MPLPEVQQVLEAIAANGYNSIGAFINDLIHQNDHLHPVVAKLATDLDQVIVNLANIPDLRSGMVRMLAIRELYEVRADEEMQLIQKHPLCKLGYKGISPANVADFSFSKLAYTYSDIAPLLWNLCCTLADVSVAEAHTFLKKGRNTDSLGDLDDDNESSESPQRKQRLKVLVATVAIGVLAFGRSRNCNALQSIVGFYLYSTRTGKRPMGVCNHIGISVSYPTILEGLNYNAVANAESLRKRAANSPLLVTYDNMTNHNKVTGETLFNKAHMYCFTTAGVMFLRMPTSLACRTGTNLDTLRQYNLLALDQRLPGESPPEFLLRRRINQFSRDIPPQILDTEHNPALRRAYLLKPNPNWNTLAPTDFMDPEIGMGYWPSLAEGILSQVVAAYFPKEVRECLKETNKAPAPIPAVYQIPIVRSDILTLATMPYDESSVEGNFQVMTDIAQRQLGLNMKDLLDKVIPISGDQLTLVRIKSGQQLRVRDLEDMRFQWAKTQPGSLHLRMSVVHLLFRSHMGRKDGQDLASLHRFIKLLGRTKIKDTKTPNLNASHDFLVHCGAGHILAAIMKECRADTLDDLAAKVKDGSWMASVKELVRKNMPLDHVDKLRDSAKEAGEQRFVPKEVPKVPRKGRTPEQRAADKVARDTLKVDEHKRKQDELRRDRDFVYENAWLFVRDYVIYYDGYLALRAGDSGRFEKHFQMVGAMFQGCSQMKNYRSATMEFNAVKAKEWTAEMHELWLLNCMVNFQGKPNKFIAIDEYNEWIVRAVKRVYNEKGSFQSTNFLCNVISLNIIGMHQCTRTLLEDTGAHNYGYKHKKVDERADIAMIVNQLVSDGVFTHHPGRSQIEDGELYHESKDTLMDGITALYTGPAIKNYIKLKTNELGGIIPDDIADGDDPSDEEDIFSAFNIGFDTTPIEHDADGELIHHLDDLI